LKNLCFSVVRLQEENFYEIRAMHVMQMRISLSCRLGLIRKKSPAVPAISRTSEETILAVPRPLVMVVRWIPSGVMLNVYARNIATGNPGTKKITASVGTHWGRNSCSTTVTVTSVTPHASAP
jgi:hypothetical protein